MRTFVTATAFSASVAAGCSSSGTGSGTSSGSASVTGNIDGRTVVAKDVVGLGGTQTSDAGVTAYAGVLISDTSGTCAAARRVGVTSADTTANVLEVVATAPGGSMRPGTYSVGNAGLAEYFYLGPNGTSGAAGNGTVTFNTVGPTTVSGSFDLNMAGGYRLTGTFSGPVCSGIPSEPWPW